MKRVISNYNISMGDKYFNIVLTPQQRNAFSRIQVFVKDPNSRVFILRGYAGTGKTTLMSGLIKWLKSEKVLFTSLASTGRAAKVLSDKTKETARTVHSQIYLFKDLNQDIQSVRDNVPETAMHASGQLSLVFDLKTNLTEDETVYIVDEASMISDKVVTSGSFSKYGSGNLLQDLLNHDKKGKFIFVGDPCQLPPIDQEFSPALDTAHLSSTYKIPVQSSDLTDIVRQQKGNGIIEASLKLRNLYTNRSYQKWANLPIKGHSNITILNSQLTLINDYIRNIKANGFANATMICQTNKHCFELNQIIRKAVMPQSDLVQIGDMLIVTQNNYVAPFVNGDLVIVTEINERIFRAGLNFVNIKVRGVNGTSEYAVLLIENILTSSQTNIDQRKNTDLLIDYHERMKKRGFNQKSAEFRQNMMFDPYLNALKANYGYALTCHKCQGGEWNEVYLHLDNKILGIPQPGVYQWWYTAVTRAKNRLFAANDWFIK